MIGAHSAADEGAGGDGFPDPELEERQSIYDLNVYTLGEAGYDYYAQGTVYTALFRGGATESDAVTLIDALDRWVSLTPFTAVGLNSVGQPALNSSAVRSGEKVLFESIYGDGIDLEFVATYNGVKEIVTLQEAPNSSSSIILWSQLNFDAETYDLASDGGVLGADTSVDGPLHLLDGSGNPAFTLPRSFVVDTPELVFDPWRSEDVTAASEHFAWLDYNVDFENGEVRVGVVLPAAIHADPAWNYPLVIDPSIQPTIAGNVVVEDETVIQTNSVTVLNGGSLQILNSTIRWDGVFTLSVATGGSITIINSTLEAKTPPTPWSFEIDGSATIATSEIRDMDDGIEVESATGFSLTWSEVSDSLGSGVWIKDQSATVTVSNNWFHDNNDAGLEFLGSASSSTATYLDNRFTENAVGIKVLSGGVTASIRGSTLEENTGYGVLCEDGSGTLRFNDTKISGSTRGVYIDDCGVEASRAVISDTTYGVEVHDSNSVTLRDFSVYPSDAADIYLRASNVIAVEGNYYEWTFDEETSTLEIRKKLSIHVVNGTGADVPSLDVEIDDKDDFPELTGLETNGLGELLDLELRLFTRSSAGTFEFMSPHQIELGVGPQESIHVFAGAKREITIHYTGDSDADGIDDAEEDNWQDATWFEAELMAKSNRSSLRESRAAGQALLGHAEGEYFRELGWPELAPGTYQFGFLGVGRASNAQVNLSATDSDGNPILGNVTYQATAGHNWYWSPTFELGSTATVHYSLRDITATPPGVFVVDRGVILRVLDGGSEPTTVLPGHFTDPLLADTDMDFGNDSIETRDEVYPFEAELLGVDPYDIVLGRAWSGRAVDHANDTDEIVFANITDLSYTNSEFYELWVRARKTVEGTAAVRLELTVGATTTPSTISLSDDFEWYQGPLDLYSTSESMIIAAYDDDDDDVEDGDDWVEVDALILAPLSANLNASRFYLSSPAQPDADMDGALDGTEINGYFISDLKQATNYTLSEGITTDGARVEFDDLDDAVHYEFTVRYQGIYKVYIPVKFGASEVQGPGPQLPYFQQLFQMALNTTTGTPIPLYAGEYAVVDYSKDPYMEGIYFQYAASFAFLWDLNVGSYNLTVYVNGTAGGVLDFYNSQFKASFDSFFIEKYRLDTLSTDYEGDGVSDGIEIEHAMFPLWVDSDYDLVTDAEEYYEGEDGYFTNPRSNDTDRDGLLDSIELGYSNDAHSASTTDPTDQDTDGDGLPDGWVDGWFSEVRPFEETEVGGTADGVAQPWEGEDLNLNGAIGGGGFTYNTTTFRSTGGETDPSDSDSENDGMDDGWELFYWGSGVGVAYILNPLVNDSANDWDPLDVVGAGPHGNGTGDNLTNLQEYAVRSHPFSADIDHDFLEDGKEVKVAFRTNVTDGAYDSDAYVTSPGNPWIYWDRNPYDAASGSFYTKSSTSTNASSDSAFNSNWTTVLVYLRDGALVSYNASQNKIYLWLHISDSSDADQNGVLEGTVITFSSTGATPGPTSNSPQSTYSRRELMGRVVWNDPDSDNDGLIDGYEGWANSPATPYNNWTSDVDLDGLINALDSDSDNDTLPDGLEWSNGDQDFDPSLGETHAFEADTDNDGVHDGNDSLPLDFDNDYLTGFASHVVSNGTIALFSGLEGTWATDRNDSDTDDDGLLDGLEDTNLNGTRDANETSPLDRDTDDDGIWDGPSIWVNASAISLDPGTAPHNDDNVDDLEHVPTGQDYLSFLDRPWYVERDQVNFTSVSLTGRAYKVYANLSAWVSHNNSTFDIGVLLSGTFQFETTVLLNKTDLNWTRFALGVIVPHSATTFTVSFYSRAAHFYLRNVSLVPGDLGEQEYGTSPISNDTDADGLQDGFEVSLIEAVVTLDAEVSGGSFALKATNGSRMEEDDDDWRSNPVESDTDGDGFRDGTWTKTFEGVPTAFGERSYDTDPSNPDTDGDGWTEPFEVLHMGTHPLWADTDNDDLPDTYEPFPLLDFDGDDLPNADDPDSDVEDTVVEFDGYSIETVGGDEYVLSVVFRTNATDGDFEAPGIWVAAAVNETGDLTGYVFDDAHEGLPGGSIRLMFDATFGGTNGQSFAGAQPVSTFEGWPVYVQVVGENWYLHIVGPDQTVYSFTREDDNAQMELGRELTWSNNRESNFLYREMLNWSAVLTQDGDNDGLSNALEGSFGTSTSDPDSDNDDLEDGDEYARDLDGMDPDSDDDGQLDGYEVKTLNSDPALPDSDGDGLWDGNFSKFAGGTINRTVGERINGTLNRDPDTDDDGLPDGWEGFYYLDPKNAEDAFSDSDLDWMDAWEEYEWAIDPNWSAMADGPYWGGTNATDLDSDNDAMPDGYEAWWGLNPLSGSDQTTDPDGDTIQNRYEYNWSIVDPDWNTPAEAWYPGLALNPFSNDTDADGLSDNYEMNRSTKDYDADLVGNGVDEDSDDDGLWDDEEVWGWNVSVIPASVLYANDTVLKNDTGDINWSIFPLWFNASDPYDTDSDNDSLNDYEEFWNGSNPKTNDTDGDAILDVNDWTTDENGSLVWTRAIQEMEPPKIEFHGYTFGACSQKNLGDCANISMTITDAGSGVFTIMVQHLGSGWEWLENVLFFTAKPPAGGGPLLETPYWMQVPISGVHDRFGTFKVLFTVADKLGNTGSQIYVGGDTFSFIRDMGKVNAAGGILDAHANGWGMGFQYATASLGIDIPSFWDDLLSGRVTSLDLLIAQIQIPHLITHAGDVFNAQFIDYMTSLAMAVNPFVPSEEDLANLQSNETMYWMRSTGAGEEDASDWLKFAISFWDGSIAGGIIGTAALTVGTAGLGAGVFAALKTTSTALNLMETLTKLVGKVQQVLKPIIASVKATETFKRVSLAVGKVWSSIKDVAGTVEETVHRLAMAASKAPSAITGRILQAFAKNPSGFLRLLCSGAAVACVLATMDPTAFAPMVGAVVRVSAKGFQVSIDDAVEIAQVSGKWASGTFNNKAASIVYHFNKWGDGRTISEYTNDAARLWQTHGSKAVWGKWKLNWDDSFKLVVGKQRGYFTLNGEILTYRGRP